MSLDLLTFIICPFVCECIDYGVFLLLLDLSYYLLVTVVHLLHIISNAV